VEAGWKILKERIQALSENLVAKLAAAGQYATDLALYNLARRKNDG
jgi:hypothetical protein